MQDSRLLLVQTQAQCYHDVCKLLTEDCRVLKPTPWKRFSFRAKETSVVGRENKVSSVERLKNITKHNSEFTLIVMGTIEEIFFSQ
jgi:hypothetical protein